MNEQQLRKLPKATVHHHFDGSVRFETIVDLAKHNSLDLGVKDNDQLYQKVKVRTPMTDLQSVLDTFWTTQKVLCNYEAIKRIAFENVEDCFRDGVKLAELRFAPTFISEGKNLSNDEIIEAVLDGITQGMDKYPIQIGLISIVPRSLDLEKNKLANLDIIKYKKSHHKSSDRLVGFDLADDEESTDPSLWAPLALEAREAGLQVTVHSGEGTKAEYVKTSIDTYGAKRIGHGIAIVDDQNILDYVKENNIHLEICPTSNWLTNCVPSLREHPIGELYKKGVSISINADDPQLMDIDLVNEYLVCHKYWDFGAQDFHKINRQTTEHSFLDDDIKQAILKQFF
ncbi:MAG: adenosine deaminase [Bacteriovoracaceae bacterium]|jgi:adenosine deaminase|nr:adenosine deaminase [Bacteriovoracaceae bacterium]